MKDKADEAAISPPPRLVSLWLFFGAVFCWTWFFWILAAGLGVSAETTPGMVLEVAGLLGPMVGGIGFAYFTLSDEGWREYWSRIIDPRRIGPTWYLVVFLFAPCLYAVAVLLDVALSGASVLGLIGERVAPFLAAPSTTAPFLVGVFVYGPIPEELGWRGYALDRLQARWSALVSSLILGSIWAVWHVPLFFIKDTLFYREGAWSVWFWLFIAVVIATAVVFTWIFNNTRRSTLAAILFHFMSNLAAGLANATAETNFYSTLLWIIAAIGVIALWSAGTPPRHEDSSPG
jgi:membrane protease YdiL (CAAX protease family)